MDSLLDYFEDTGESFFEDGPLSIVRPLDNGLTESLEVHAD
ncbi:hypothetical protein SAMN05192552_103014 [Natrinema hispanicum]|uniref:Uncharacterized protein n=2 Tax=Natrinema hispanicum TaxID=392421 RepID=A0A1G6VNQ4_9EURY|nr:hypothetical protein SAMN05192552_103014 [Natrinema hispanicum]